MPPAYSPQLLASIKRTVTIERLTRYLRATHQQLPKALELYEYNLHLSEILYGFLHTLEVSVRNAQHHALTAGFGTPAWYDVAHLSQYWADQLTKAKTKAGRTTGTPGKIIAELTFGFWVDLLSQSNHMSLWVDRKLHTAFPNSDRNRRPIHHRLKQIQLLRNRISHHEPILTAAKTVYNGCDMLKLSDMLECVEWVCPDTAKWMRDRFRYAEAEGILSDVAAMGIPL